MPSAPHRAAALAAALSAAALLVSTPASSEEGAQEVRVNQDVQLLYNSLSGAGSGQSSLTANGSYESRLGVSVNGETKSGQYYVNFGGLGTDDQRSDPKSLSLTNFQGRLNRGPSTFNLGDTFESFSQYSMASAVKGLSYKYSGLAQGRPEATLLFGYAYPRWDNFYGDREVAAIERRAYGVQVKQRLTNNWSAGVHYTRSDESDRVTATDPLLDATVYGASWEFKPFEGLSLTGESSFGRATQSPGVGVANRRLHGNAHRVSFAGEGDDVRLTVDYERVSPNFTTTLGSAVADREKAKARWRQRNGRNTTVNYGFLWWRDNRDGQKAFTTNHYQPEIAVSVRRVADRPYATLDASYKLDRRLAGAARTMDQYLDLGYRDRFGEWDSDTRLGVVLYNTTTGIRDSRDYTLNTALSTRETRGQTVVSPSLYLGTWRARDELLDTTDKVYELSLGAGIDFPERNLRTSVKLGRHKLIRDAGDDTSKTFANLSVYYRPGTRVGPFTPTFFLRWLLNDFSVTTQGRNFKENSLVAGMNVEL